MLSCCILCLDCLFFVFFKQKTAYEMRISDWSSDVCSSDLHSYRARRIEGTAGADRRKRKGACRRNIARRQITDTGGREIKGPRALKMSGQGRAPSSLSAAT